MSESMTAAVRDFICTCPFLAKGKVNVNYLSADPTEYAIERVAANDVLKEYSDGGKLKQFVFLFSSREWIGRSVGEHLKISKFYEDFSDWLEEMNRIGVLPKLGKGKSAQSIGVVSCGRLYNLSGECAKFQILCRLVYFEQGKTEVDI